MVITDGVINFPYVVMTELSESTSLNNVVKLPPPTPISAWPYQPEDLLPLSELDA